MAHQFIIYSLPNSILMLCVHLDTPHETFTYLEKCYGQIPRPDIVNEAAQQCHVPSEQYLTEESAPSTCNNGSGNSPSDEGNSPESPIDCAKTTAGCTKPKTEVVDAQQVEDNLLEVEDRATDSHLKRLTRANKASAQTLSSMSMELQLPVYTPRYNEAHIPYWIFQPPERENEKNNTPLTKADDLEPCPKEPDKAENTGGGGDDAVSKELVDLCRAEKSMLADSGSQQGEQEAKQPKCSPAPPAASPNGMMDVLIPLTDQHQCGRIKVKAESISNTQMQQNAYCTQVALMWPFLALLACSNQSLDPVGGLQTMNLVQPLFTPMKWLKYPTGGYKMMKRGYNEIRHVRQVETRGGMYRTACILMQLLLFLSDPSKQLQNIGNTYWWEGVPTRSMQNDVKQQGNIPMAIQRPHSSSTRQDIEHRAKWPNNLPMPFKPTRYDLSHLPGTLRDPR
ncbi:hypothetical protein F5141DRAFT_1202563 [Pisolithus sp. B1]|nr:hypothetical protein F5141DRAFT_1202563 [Pisolithus sp. B1]